MPSRGDRSETFQVQRPADRLPSAPRRGRHQRRGGVCRKAGISVQTYYRWSKKYGGLMPSEMKRLKQLEEENQRLKRLVADLSLDKEMLWEVGRKKL